MGRIRTEIDIDGRKCWTLFDSGARNTYVVHEAVQDETLRDLPSERIAAFGGTTHTVKKSCHLFALVEGHWIETVASVVDEIGKDEDGRPIEVLFGALAMQLWGIRLDLKNEKLDFTHYTTEFVEY